MIKITPNSPENPSVSPYDPLDASKLHPAADQSRNRQRRALCCRCMPLVRVWPGWRSGR